MTREEARKAAEVMLAYAEGKEIEVKIKCGCTWKVTSPPAFSWGYYDYRIKPSPQYRPFKNAEECWQEMLKHKPFGCVKKKDSTEYSEVTWVSDEEDGCGMGVDFRWKLSGFFKDFTFADGTPFGVEEESV